jgi:hypothetical protein
MPSFSCERCCREFGRKDYLQKHLQRKFPCKPMEFKQSPNLTTFNHVLPHLTTFNNQEPRPLDLDSNHTPCEYCSKNINKKMMNRHYRDNCKKIPKSVKNNLLEKYKKNKKHIKALEVSKVINSNNSNTTNNTTNNTTTTNSHNNITNNNNITIKINPLGKENTDFLKNSDILNIINRCYMAIPDLIMKIHDRAENKNFFIPNVNRNDMAYLGENNEIEYNDYNEICEKIISDNIQRLDTYYYKFEKKLSKHIKKRMKSVMRENDNEELNEKYMKNIKYYLMNVSKKNKIALNKFIENIEKQIKSK